ncbi:hypothetical protein [uncultured Clostridium sp.]|uniref:hypothetical protein n=1 Tax=uncultured Clostridium sp. TaxID=59620 RepID=UPI00258CD810|nr:hypothetical protein [uncultured Clostridium sp.]MDU1350587.1 hypothetical protein [Clostridium argentinense]
MDIYQSFLIFIILSIPVTLMLLNHPINNVIRIAKITLLLSIVGILILFPVIVIIRLKIWTLLLVAIPILARIIQYILNKAQIQKYLSRLDDKQLFNLLITCLGTILFFYLSIDFNIIYGFWFSLFLFVFATVKPIREITNSNILYGAVFGLLSTAMTVYINIAEISNTDAIITFLFSWFIIGVPLNVIPSLKKSESSQVLGFILIPSLYLILLKKGGVNILLPEFFKSGFFLLICILLIWIMNKLINEKKLPIIIKQFLLPTLLVGILAFFIGMQNRADELKLILSLSTYFLSILCILLAFGRGYFSILYGVDENRKLIKEKEITEGFKWILGDNLGIKVFKFLFGENYIQIGMKTALVFIGIIIIQLFIAMNILDENVGNISLPSYLQFVIPLMCIMTSTRCSITLLNEIIGVINLKNNNANYNRSHSEKTGVTISVNYYLIIISVIVANTYFNSTINIYFLIFIMIWFALCSLSFSIILSKELQTKDFNNFQRTRHMLSVMLYGIGKFSVAYFLISLYQLDIYNYNLKYNIVLITLIPFVATLIAKLVGYDTLLASKKLKEDSFRRAVFLIIYFAFFAMFNHSLLSNIFFYIFHSEKVAILIAFSVNVLLFYELMESLPILIIPHTNNKAGNMKDYIIMAWRHN